MANLGDMRLSNNYFTGWIPTELGSSKIGRLDLDSNNLSGSIPSQVGNMPGLFQLLLHNNSLTGALPEELDVLVRDGGR